MTFPSYTDSSSARLASRDITGILGGLWTSIASFLVRGFGSPRFSSNGPSRRSRSIHREWTTMRSSWPVPLGLILLWVWALWWGEKMTFKWMIDDCAWARWENWVSMRVRAPNLRVRFDRDKRAKRSGLNLVCVINRSKASRSKPPPCHPRRRSTTR
jgi:hypothetical protein